MSRENNAARPSTTSLEPKQFDHNDHDGIDARIIDLHLQEYIALRAEQRTRLDSANKIIHYYAIVLAAVVVGLVTVYKNGGEAAFNSIFPLILLSLPVITIPFVLAQQNEEIIVRNIGDYFRLIKGRISSQTDERYWTWEEYHYTQLSDLNTTKSFSLKLTAFSRAGLLIFFSIMSLVVYHFTY